MNLYLNYPSWIKPEIVSFLPIRWYGIMYMLAFGIAYIFYRQYIKTSSHLKHLSSKTAEDMFFTGIMGLLIGARLFYVIFYNPQTYIDNPLAIISPYIDGQFVGIQGISYHGGVLGAFLGLLFYCKRHKIPFLPVIDAATIGIPFGYTFGRLGNFTNAELYGKVTANPIGMLFPNAEPVSTHFGWVREIAEKHGIDIAGKNVVNLPRHASQLYEMFGEGIVLGLFLYFIVPKYQKFAGAIPAFYLMGYGLIRFMIEYLREPDRHIGYVLAFGEDKYNPALFTSFLNFSEGQLFCLAMTLLGFVLYLFCKKNQDKSFLK